ncbi:alpha/beta hydrolase [uncultured Mucilaginibacter sp.]|uniref:alpha/beta fold hydrolase n=1 Tax=uncultured Mucilaginibacter sp. TaxID=797541 RepID=UPI00260F1BA1|nr:alpha/beta hydrolase [uncultured Mucilaginibacter sp.]
MPFLESKNNNETPVKIFYQDLGQGKPVVLIHGWPLTSDSWEYQLNELPAHGFRVIAYDRRGFGKSDKPWGNYDYSTLASDLKALLDELDLNEVTLVGFSMGGGEVIRYLSLYGSERIAKIVLVSSIIPYLLKTDDNPEGVPQKMFDEFETQLRDDRPKFLAAFGKQFYNDSLLKPVVSSEMLDWTQMLALTGSGKATIDCMKAFSSTDFRAEVSTVKVPTLIIHGDDDQTVPIKTSGEQASKLLPDAKFIIYKGAPHGLFITEKEKLTADLVDFIA